MSIDLTTTTESVAAETQRRTTRKNLTSNSVIFYVRVLTAPLPYDQEDANVILKQGWIEPPKRPWGNPFATSPLASDAKSTADKNPKIMFRGRILKSNNGLKPHILLRDPCKVGLGRDLAFIYKLLQKHTLFISKDGFFGHTPQIGDVVQVSLPPSDFDGPDLQVSFFDSIVDKSSANEFGDYLSRVNCESLKDKMSRGLDFDGSATKLSNLGAAIRLQSFIDTTQEVEANKILKGTSFPKLTGIADTELNLWGPLTPPQKVESDPEMYKVLKKYWDNLDWDESKWSPTGVPWSAAFVSYLMNQVDSEFPGSAGHYYYIKNAKSGKGNYSAWNLTTAKGKVQAQVGDILVRKRTPDVNNPETAMHGDVVYQIVNNEAFLAGGNVGSSKTGQQTAKIVKIMTLKNGYYSSLKSSSRKYPYEVILKKNAVLEDE